jgi:hypothetical protein
MSTPRVTKRHHTKSPPLKDSSAPSDPHEQIDQKPAAPSTGESETSADLKKLIGKFVIKRFGVRGVVIFGCTVLYFRDLVEMG